MSDYGRRNNRSSGGQEGEAFAGGQEGEAYAPGSRSRRPRRARTPRGVPRSTGNIFIGNSPVNMHGNKILNMLDVLAELKINGFTPETFGAPADSRIFLEILNGLGFDTVDKKELSPGINNLKNFSLMGSKNIDETIDNPNIIDPDLNKLTPVLIPTNDKFKNAADAFYELDESAPDTLKRHTKSQKTNQTVKLRPIADQIARSAKRSKNKMITNNNKASSI